MNNISTLYQKFSETNGVCTDTRKVVPGSMFVALKGPNFNANSFVVEALEKGCKYAVTDDVALQGSHDNLLYVDNGLKFLQDLACYHRRKMNCKILAIGGSNGKTTTKELVSKILSCKYSVIHTHGNLNNHIGVPLTLLQINENHEMAVIETGANKIGDMEELCSIALPDYGIITNIGKEHLEGFGSIEGVVKGEGELFDYLLKNKGVAFVNENDEWLPQMASDLENVVWYGNGKHSSIRAFPITLNPNISYTLELNGKVINASSILSGDYNFTNILAALCIGNYFKVEPEVMISAIAEYIPQNNRSQVVSKGIHTLYLDAYNANPSSMEVALKNFSTVDHPNKVVLLGDMFELGDFAPAEHQAIVDLCVVLGFDTVYFAGNYFSNCNLPSNYIAFTTTEELGKYLSKLTFEKTVFFFKGSRGMKMETLVDFVS